VFPCGSEGAAAAFGLAAGRDAVIEEALWRPTAPQKTQFGRSSADLKNAKSGNRLFAAPNFGSAAQCSPPLPKHLLPGVAAAHRHQHAPRAETNPRADLEQSQPNRVDLGLGQRRASQR
jgi:hypothetical protein